MGLQSWARGTGRAWGNGEPADSWGYFQWGSFLCGFVSFGRILLLQAWPRSASPSQAQKTNTSHRGNWGAAVWAAKCTYPHLMKSMPMLSCCSGPDRETGVPKLWSVSAKSLGASAQQPGKQEGSGLLGSGWSCAQSGFLRDNKPWLMKKVMQIEMWEIMGLGWWGEVMGWECNTGVMSGAHSVPWGGLVPCGAGALARPGPQDLACCCLGWSKSLVKSTFSEELLCHWCFLTKFPLSLRTLHLCEHRPDGQYQNKMMMLFLKVWQERDILADIHCDVGINGRGGCVLPGTMKLSCWVWISLREDSMEV